MNPERLPNGQPKPILYYTTFLLTWFENPVWVKTKTALIHSKRAFDLKIGSKNAQSGDRFCDQGFQIERGLVNSYFCLFHLGNHILSTIEEFGFQESPKPRGCRRFINKELIRSF